MEEEDNNDDIRFTSNWSDEYLENINISEYPFPNNLWHVKPVREIVIKSSMMVIVAVFGIFLNIIILVIIMKNRWLWNTSNYLVGNLAFMDLLTLVFCPWFMLVRDFYQNFVLKNFGCRFEGFMQASLLLASVGAVMLVSYDRLAAAAMNSEARITKKAAPRLIIGTWFIAAALSLPWTFKREYQERQWLDFLEMYCAEDARILGVYWHVLLTLLVWVPLGVMVLTYGAIIWRLECSARELSSRGGGRTIRRARARAMRITACVLVTALVCRLPYTALIYWRNNMTEKINAVDGSFATMWFAANFLMYLNCAANPLIYGFTNPRFRNAMDRTPGVACFKFGNWCCACSMFRRPDALSNCKNTDKIFVIENSPRPNKKLSRVIKNMLNIKKESVEFSVKVDEVTTKPTKVMTLKMDNI
ncbi:RYamide receptor [Manduca sexta]|uniref:G-protein coupled receptors family 1 profile domain-containing protein n=1 Tax=Manduca sexta TaxID=7130 RepID=A0A921Z590_MANSE|nr:RYamide receptor [Manduca sexta]KAG6451372.1 hypothetical protein O3G_MSEX007115 [Manduca sexta]KAG6451373.1 hypothetical protein O3G_MSEX007115 [Manduca sexta]